MSIDKLYKACEKFQKLAEKKIVLDPKKPNIGFWSKFLRNAIASYANMFPNVDFAQRVYDAIAAYHKAPAYSGDGELKEIRAIQQALSEASSRLQQAGLNVVEVLQKLGMQNVNPNIINILLANLKIMEAAREGVDIKSAGYQHYSLPRAGQANPADIIDLDKPDTSTGPGY